MIIHCGIYNIKNNSKGGNSWRYFGFVSFKPKESTGIKNSHHRYFPGFDGKDPNYVPCGVVKKLNRAIWTECGHLSFVESDDTVETELNYFDKDYLHLTNFGCPKFFDTIYGSFCSIHNMLLRHCHCPPSKSSDEYEENVAFCLFVCNFSTLCP